jgi:hypothetical protein
VPTLALLGTREASDRGIGASVRQTLKTARHGESEKGGDQPSRLAAQQTSLDLAARSFRESVDEDDRTRIGVAEAPCRVWAS